MQLIELPSFTRKVASRLDDDSLGEWYVELMGRPDPGKLVSGGGGLRKVRFRSI